ncbi:MAG: diacylglycerol kinase [Elusimicrobiota bacterium]
MPGEDKKPGSSSHIVASFDYALKGLVYAIKTERNMRIHVIIGILVLMAAMFLNLTRMELIAVIFAIALVFITELLNTAAELMVNLITEQHHPQAKIIKDMTAGTVLFSSICAAVVGYIIFMKADILDVFEKSFVLRKISVFPPYFSAAVVFLVLFSTLLIKGLKQKVPSFEGGMPSIHTAIAFSLAILIYFLSSSFYALLLSVFLALMVAQSRLESRIHSLWEVVVGALLGVAVTVLVFQVIM